MKYLAYICDCGQNYANLNALEACQLNRHGAGILPTDAELLRSLRASWEERGRILDRLLVARMVDLASVAMLIDRSPNSDALSELKGVILEAVEVIKGLRGKLEINHEKT